MANKWPSRRFGDLLALGLRAGLTRPKKVRGEGVPMVNMGEVFAHQRLGDIDMERVPLSDAEATKFLLLPGDLLFARQSLVASGAGKCVLFVGAREPVTFESHLIRARMNRDIGDARFYFYFFNTERGRRLMQTIVEQVSAAGIRASDLRTLEVPFPPLERQREIADALEAFDEYRDGLLASAHTTEALILAQLRAQLIEFDSATSLSDSPIGPVPRGWDVMPLGEVAESARSVEKPETAEPDAPYLGLDAMPRGSTVLSRWGSRSEVAGTTLGFKTGDLLFGKLRPYFKKVGVAPLDGSCSTEILVVRPRDPELYAVVLAHLTSQEFIDHADAVSSGTRMPRAEWRAASSYLVAVPPMETAARMTELATDFYALIRQRIQAARTLEELRELAAAEMTSGRTGGAEPAAAEAAA